LNRCLDYAIAYAVTAFSIRHDFIESDRHHAEENKRMGFFVPSYATCWGRRS